MVSPEAAVLYFSLTRKPVESCFAKCFEILLQTGFSAPPAEELECSLYKEASALLLTGIGGQISGGVAFFRRGPDVLQLLGKAVTPLVKWQVWCCEWTLSVGGFAVLYIAV